MPVFAVPGPSALAAAVSVAGIDSSRVLFAGFAPRKASEREELLREARGITTALVLFESPNRLASLLGAVADVYGDDCPVTLCRELTKLHEEVVHDTAAALAARSGPERGECTLVVAVPEAPEPREGALDMLAAMKRAGAQRSAAAAEVARATGVPRSELYDAWDAV
ncbi:MAG: SAM-dependent methyltransferase [Dehalococcoidia bacterium]|nr:SAM-dependent methyltransferase [Dehalococcoidia bacterium]